VAIAAAVTCYARIYMKPYINMPGVAYVDKESRFSTNPVPKNFITNRLR
jgi:hypothetical protein